MSWLIPSKPHPLLLFSPFSLLFSFIYITHSNPPLLYFPSLSPSVTIPRSHVTLSPLPLLLSPVPLLLCLLTLCYYPLFSCYSVSSYPVPPLLILCYFPRSFVTLSPFTLSPYILSCKECLPVLSTGAFTLSKTGPFKHAEHAFLAPWRRPSCM